MKEIAMCIETGYIAVMQAKKDGKVVQLRFKGKIPEDSWGDVQPKEILDWDFRTFEYRVKPKPPEYVWQWVYTPYTPPNTDRLRLTSDHYPTAEVAKLALEKQIGAWGVEVLFKLEESKKEKEL